jgi:hypothetical protein
VCRLVERDGTTYKVDTSRIGQRNHSPAEAEGARDVAALIAQQPGVALEIHQGLADGTLVEDDLTREAIEVLFRSVELRILRNPAHHR